MRTQLGAIMLAAQIMLTLPAFAASKDDPWENLRHVTWHRTYTFVDRQGNCVDGEILIVTGHDVTLKRPDATTGKRPNYTTVNLERPNVLRVTDGPKGYDVVYSGKSSWSDVKSIEGIPGYEALLFITKDGKRHKGKLLEISDKHVKLAQWNKAAEIAKGDVSRVYYIREKPLSGSAMYAAQEMFLLDPELWPHILHIPPKIPVLLYDSSMPEDDAPVRCKNNPWTLQ